MVDRASPKSNCRSAAEPRSTGSSLDDGFGNSEKADHRFTHVR
jgi:hypothetical protein